MVTSGFDVIHRHGELRNHPLYSFYFHLSSISRNAFSLCPFPFMHFSKPEDAKQVMYCAILFKQPDLYCSEMLWGLPGQPHYRSHLGCLFPPPFVKFDDFNLKLDSRIKDDHFLDLIERVDKFRRMVSNQKAFGMSDQEMSVEDLPDYEGRNFTKFVHGGKLTGFFLLNNPCEKLKDNYNLWKTRASAFFAKRGENAKAQLFAGEDLYPFYVVREESNEKTAGEEKGAERGENDC